MVPPWIREDGPAMAPPPSRGGMGLEGATGDEIRSSPLLSPSNWQFLVRRGVNRELEKTG